MIARFFFCLKAFRSAMYVLHVLRNIDPRRWQQIPWAIRMATASSTLKLKRCRTGRQHQPLHSYIQLLHATDCYSLLLYLIASVSANHPDFAWCWVSFVSTRDCKIIWNRVERSLLCSKGTGSCGSGSPRCYCQAEQHGSQRKADTGTKILISGDIFGRKKRERISIVLVSCGSR
jgi:hypothetical protein